MVFRNRCDLLNHITAGHCQQYKRLPVAKVNLIRDSKILWTDEAGRWTHWRTQDLGQQNGKRAPTTTTEFW